MKRTVALLLLIFSMAMVPATSALAFNTQIKVYASVAEQRAVYVNQAGIVYKVAGNTSKNIEPLVFNQDNQPTTMTDSVKTQYENFMKQHGWNLDARKIYDVNPVIIDTSQNTQTIQLSSTPYLLTLSQ